MFRESFARWLAIAIVFAVAETAAQVRTPAPNLRSLTVKSEPNARVWIDGVLYGRTGDTGSLTIDTVAAGRRSIRVRAEGFKDGQKVVLPVQSGEVAIPLTRTTDEADVAFHKAEHLTTVDREKAIEAYRQTLKLRPSHLDAAVGLARMYTDKNDFENAEKAIAQARRLKPGLAEISAIEGRLYKSTNEEEKAIASFKRAIREGSGFQPEAYAGLGLLYKEKAELHGASGEFEQETAAYDEAARNLAMAIKQLSGAPDAPVLYQFLGLVYEQQKKPEKAIAVYEEFLRYFPGHSESDAFKSFIVQLKKADQ